ncbi:hypothetical protein [Actinomadura sp. 7K507]|uniref:hypothetical protein n=1 Tax=Actinomadura sp. 7K507 TaxID=2530365 RepID=UPI00104754C1|nr:hypothetical protein [Actinomadura sp. 7K507]TDC75124.1 hypothetical protein E1285_41900 [Actinomadura sp. 7K507]
MRRALPLAVSLSGLLLAGCADAGKAVPADPPTAGAGGSARPAKSEGAFAKEGWFGGADGLHARIAIKGVERRGAKSVLLYSVTSLDSSTKSVTFAINLLDPVGRRLYKPTGSTSGDGFAPGTTREMAAEYPAIPQNVEKITALTPGTAGEFTGIPVTGTPTGASTPTAPSTPTGASTPTSPGTGTGGASAQPSTNPAVLYDVTEDGTEDDAASASPSTSAGSPSATAGSPSVSAGSPSASAGSPSASVESPSVTVSGGRTGTPADFRPQDGEKVASRSARFGEAKRRLEVKPFYRDGAYIVAVFDIVNEGPKPTPADASYAHKDYPGGVFTSFSIQIPEREEVYRAVRVGLESPGAPSAYVAPGRAVFRTGVDQPVRGFVYLPAPSEDITSVVFDGGPFGKVNKVPVT